MAMLSDPALIWTARLTLALVFALSAWTKFSDPERFAGVLADYRVLPEGLVRLMAWAVPTAEAAAVLGLLLAPLGTASGIFAGALLLLFSGAVLINLLRGRTHIDCGCFGSAGRQRIGWGLIVRNGALLAFAAAVSLAGGASREVVWLDAVTVSAAAVAIVVLYGALGALRPPPLPDAGFARLERP
jgi:hypothetical protein